MVEDVVIEEEEELEQKFDASHIAISKNVLNEAISRSVLGMLQEPSLSEFGQANIDVRRNCPSHEIVDTDGGYPKTLTLDFGELGCNTIGNSIGMGKIILEVFDPIDALDGVCRISFENFSLNGCGVNLVGDAPYISLINKIAYYDVIVEDGTLMELTTPDAVATTFTGFESLTIACIDNDPPFDWTLPDLLDACLNVSITKLTGVTGNNYDYFELSTNGTDFNGDLVDDPLVFKCFCRYIYDGSLFVDGGGDDLEIINYGYGNACDGEVEVCKVSGCSVVVCP